MNRNNNDDRALALIPCGDCGRMVPESNLAIHLATACGARARRAPTTPERPFESSLSNSETARQPQTPLSDSKPPAQPSAMETDNPEDNESSSFSEAITVDDVATPANNNTANDVVDLTADTPPQNQWACSVCTLLNPLSTSICGACMHGKDGVRPADPSIRERLVPDSPTTTGSVLPSGAASGALLGGVLGAANAYMGGHPVGSAALEGAVTGFVGGALVGDVVAGLSSPTRSASPRTSAYDIPVASTRTGASMGLPTYPSPYSPDSSMHHPRPRGRMQPRSSVRVMRGRNGDSYTTTIYSSGTGNADPALMNLMMQSILHPPPSTGNMSYEELLRVFGDGTENMGASEDDIQNLPTATLQDPKAELPRDQMQCCICLEDFEASQERKTLPCLHGFHSKCVDKWLRSNGSCPICKHKISS